MCIIVVASLIILKFGEANAYEIKALMETLEADHGAGSLNLETGEFTPVTEAQMEIVK